MSSTLSVRDVCERLGVNEHTVLGWIRSGELRAVNVGRRPGGKKPRWRITQEALEAFEQLRTSPTSSSDETAEEAAYRRDRVLQVKEKRTPGSAGEPQCQLHQNSVSVSTLRPGAESP